MKNDLTILLPAHNEEVALGSLLDELKRNVNIPHDLIVVDNASTDRTASIALDGGARVLCVREKGKGNAIRSAIRTIDTPFVVMMNSDLTYPPMYVRLLYRQLKLGADVVIGCRAIVDKGAMPPLHSLGNWSLTMLASLLYGYALQDLCTGMWGFKTSVLNTFNLSSSGFTLEADLFTNAVKGGHELRQVPIGYRSRMNGDKPKLHVADGFKIGWFLLRTRFGR